MYDSKLDELKDMKIDMEIAILLSKINEYKGRQVLYAQQDASILDELSSSTLLYNSNMIYNDGDSIDSKVGIHEFRDVLKTINVGHEDLYLSLNTILHLHGYLHKFLIRRDGVYRTKNQSEIRKIVEGINGLCYTYNKFSKNGRVDSLVLIVSFVYEFLRIEPFRYGNENMAKLIFILLLNKHGYDIAKYMEIESIFSEYTYNRVYSVSSNETEMNVCIKHVLIRLLMLYKRLDEKLNVIEEKKLTKADRIEKIVNSTLGYFTKDDIKQLCEDIPDSTINRVFNKLRQEGKIEVIAKGRNAKWKKSNI